LRPWTSSTPTWRPGRRPWPRPSSGWAEPRPTAFGTASGTTERPGQRRATPGPSSSPASSGNGSTGGSRTAASRSCLPFRRVPSPGTPKVGGTRPTPSGWCATRCARGTPWSGGSSATRSTPTPSSTAGIGPFPPGVTSRNSRSSPTWSVGWPPFRCRSSSPDGAPTRGVGPLSRRYRHRSS